MKYRFLFKGSTGAGTPLWATIDADSFDDALKRLVADDPIWSNGNTKCMTTGSIHGKGFCVMAQSRNKIPASIA